MKLFFMKRLFAITVTDTLQKCPDYILLSGEISHDTDHNTYRK